MNSDYMVLLMQVFLKKPVGLKPVYSKDVVALAMELHTPPEKLYEEMMHMAWSPAPHIVKMLERYKKNTKLLDRHCKMVRSMEGLGNADVFYSGVALKETFEPNFRPIPGVPDMLPIGLVLVLDLYYRLTPSTMVEATPEVVQLARLMRVSPQRVTQALSAFRQCDPFCHRHPPVPEAMLKACRPVWRQWGNADPMAIAARAALLAEYFK